jgi:hypothetical protein
MIPDKNPYNNWNGNGSTTTFDFDFYIEDETQLAVYHTNSKGVQTLLKYGTDYSINELQNENGSFINFPLASSTYSVLSENEVISLCLTLPITQENPYSKSSYLNLKTLEYSLDYLTRICQIISRQMERSVKTQEGSSQTAEELVQALNDAQVNAAASASEAANSASGANISALNSENSANLASEKASFIQEKADLISANAQAILTKATTSLNNLTADGEARFDCKVNTDGSNLTNVSNAFKAQIVHWGIPDYDSRIDTGKQTPYTAPCDGLFVYSNNSTDSYMGSALVNGFVVSTLRSYTTDCFPVAKNDVITLANTPQIATTYFVPMKGEINTNV